MVEIVSTGQYSMGEEACIAHIYYLLKVGRLESVPYHVPEAVHHPRPDPQKLIGRTKIVSVLLGLLKRDDIFIIYASSLDLRSRRGHLVKWSRD
jgi:hypothetical protein